MRTHRACWPWSCLKFMHASSLYAFFAGFHFSAPRPCLALSCVPWPTSITFVLMTSIIGLLSPTFARSANDYALIPSSACERSIAPRVPHSHWHAHSILTPVSLKSTTDTTKASSQFRAEELDPALTFGSPRSLCASTSATSDPAPFPTPLFFKAGPPSSFLPRADKTRPRFRCNRAPSSHFCPTIASHRTFSEARIDISESFTHVIANVHVKSLVCVRSAYDVRLCRTCRVHARASTVSIPIGIASMDMLDFSPHIA